MKRQLLFTALALVLSATVVFAQSTCEVASADELSALAENCQQIDTDTICTADDSTPLDDALPGVAAPAQFSLGNLKFMYWGPIELAEIEAGEVSPTLLRVTNQAGFNVNLRGGPGTNFDVVDTLGFDEEEIADARSEDDLWVRLQTNEGTAWVSESLIRFEEGASEDLPIAIGAEETGSPLQTLNFSFAEDCNDATGSVLMWTSDGGRNTAFSINDTDIRLGDALAYMTLERNATRFYVLSGEAQIESDVTPEELEDMSSTTMEAGQGTLLAAERQPESLAFSSADILETLPAVIREEQLAVCYAVPEADPVFLYQEPMEDSTASVSEEALLISGRLDSEGKNWVTIDIAEGETAYAVADEINLLGNCDNLPLVQGPSIRQAPPAQLISLPPAATMNVYLEAMVAGNATRMQQVSCEAWDFQASIQSQSFAAANAELEGAVCQTVNESGESALVQCSGKIVTEYDGEFRDFPLSQYQFVREAGAWRMCGEG